MLRRNLLAALTFGILALPTAAAHAAQGAPPTEVVAVRRSQLPADSKSADWNNVPAFSAPLIQQDMVEPRLMAPSTDRVEVKAVSDGKRVAFRLEWTDPDKNDLPGTGKFSDGCAVQLPVGMEADVPAPQMGEPNRPVEISYWRASWQAMADGREDSIKVLQPNAAVDHYPFEAASLQAGSGEQKEMAKRYAPAQAVDNPMGGPRQNPMQDLVAEGPGTLSPAAQPQSDGRGMRTAKGWSVVISRPLPKGLEPGNRTQVAFAIWEGSHQEAGARKMRSAWTPLLLEKGK